LQALTSSSNDRILLIVGAGHLPILRFLAESSPEHRLRELAEFVAP
jgi:pheromone shutdown protein TraB